jgi:hypothetical protein
MSLYSEVLQVLGKPEIQHIDFRVDNGIYCGNAAHHISRALFTEVAGYVREGRIRVESGGVPAGLAAVYRPGEDTMRFSEENFLGYHQLEGYVMHEAVHAWMDANRRRDGDPVTEEGIGFLVQELYLRQFSMSLVTGEGDSGAVFGATRNVADAIGRERNPHVTFRDMWPLYDAIARHPSYAHLCGVPEAGMMCMHHETDRNDGLNGPAGGDRF